MPSAGDTLSLGALGKAVGVNGNTTSQTALAANGRGSTGTQTSLSDFYISAVDSSISGVDDTTPNESTTDAVTIGFSNEGSLFASRIKDVAANFTWARSTTLGYQGGVTFSGNQDYRATVNYGTVDADQTVYWGVTFADNFNNHAIRYNAFISQQVEIQNTGGGGGGGHPGGGP
jgi:hypothetical protein